MSDEPVIGHPYEYRQSCGERACKRCGGLGVVREDIDEVQRDVAVYCYLCMTHCSRCAGWFRKPHRCGEEIELLDIGKGE